MNYTFRYRRPRSLWPFWRAFQVSGHTLSLEQDKVILFFPDGGVQEISSWQDCEIKLGQDWVLAQKRALESQTGQPVPLVVGV